MLLAGSLGGLQLRGASSTIVVKGRLSVGGTPLRGQTFSRVIGTPDGASVAPDGAVQAEGTWNSARCTQTGLRCDEQISFKTWNAIGVQIGTFARASPWWLGDWLLFGKQKYGRRYREATSATGLEYQTLRNYAVVARRFPVSRRRDKLTFQHHAEVCALPDVDQDFWLDLAIEYHWSKAELRRRVQAARARERSSRAGTLRLSLEPQREQLWREAARESDCRFGTWVRRTLDDAAVNVLKRES